MDPSAHPEESLGELVRRFRIRSGLSQEKLAELAGITSRTVTNIEGDRHTPHDHTLVQLAEALGLPTSDRELLAAARRRRLATTGQARATVGSAGGPALPVPTGLSGLWVSPGPDFVVEGDQVRFAARAWPTTPTDPPVRYVNFTATWDGPEGGWRSACAASGAKPGTPDTYECVWDLTPNVPDGPIVVSFDVYGERGNLNKAPHGKRRGTVRRRP